MSLETGIVNTTEKATKIGFIGGAISLFGGEYLRRSFFVTLGIQALVISAAASIGLGLYNRSRNPRV